MTLHEEQERVQNAVANSLSHVQASPWLAQRVLAHAKGEQPMKKRISMSVLLLAALMAIAAVGLAASSLTGIRDFLGEIVGGWNVNEDAIVAPTIQSSTSQWLKLEATEAYWAEDGLAVVLKVGAADNRHIVCYSNEDGFLDEEGEMSGQIQIQGKQMDIDLWRGEKELLVTHYLLQEEGWTWYKRTEEGLFVIVTSWNLDAASLETGMDLTLEIITENIQTGEHEGSTITVALPPMRMQAGYK